jgi:hypothetical protein
MTHKVKNSEISAQSHAGSGTTEPFDQISIPGCYVLNRTGELLRVPDDALAPGRSPVLDVVSSNQWLVTRISTNPYLTLSKARSIAADMDLGVNF